MTVKNLAIIVLSSLLLSACGRSTMFSDYQSVDINGWQMDSVLRFDIPITDTASAYNVILHIRHTDAYPYQNMWLFVNDGTKNIGDVAKTDTIEFYLADDRGQWLGNGHAIKDMPVLYREHFQFSAENLHTSDSIYTLTIQQGMREVLLPGVCEIGVEVVR